MQKDMFSLILLAGGEGSRMKKELPKQFLMLSGKPVIMHILERVDTITEIKEIIIVCHKNYCDHMRSLINAYSLKKPCKIIEGGVTRQESVYKGLNATDSKMVILHEAARPFVTKTDFLDLMNAEGQNVSYSYDIPFTIIKGDKFVTGDLVRSELKNVQLPQKFERALLLKAHEKAIKDGLVFSEDAGLLFHYFKPEIRLIRGASYNLKLTEQIDLIMGEIIYKEYILNH